MSRYCITMIDGRDFIVDKSFVESVMSVFRQGTSYITKRNDRMELLYVLNIHHIVHITQIEER